ncbi:MAG: MBL fold metallo-hydrolase, partial [Chloroflexota bacterium]
MKITFYGAAKTVTGSQHMVEVDGKRILLDCGLYQGRRRDMEKVNRNLPFDPASVDVLVLSHAHIDHSGNIPNLVKSGYTGDIIATPATVDLCGSMLLDSGNIQERNAEYANRYLQDGEPEHEPIYTQADAEHALKSFKAQPYGEKHEILPGVELTFIEA